MSFKPNKQYRFNPSGNYVPRVGNRIKIRNFAKKYNGQLAYITYIDGGYISFALDGPITLSNYTIAKLILRHMSDDWYYIDDRWCSICGDCTEHQCHDSTHERDSSEDYQKCNVCGWALSGYSSRPIPPE